MSSEGERNCDSYNMEKCSLVRKGAWTGEEDRLLRMCIEKYGEGKWHQVPERAGLNRCRKSCRLRWLNYLKPNIKRGEFTEDEVDMIIRLHKLLGNRWSLIAGRLPGRTANDVKNYCNTHLRKKTATSNQRAQVPKTLGTAVVPKMVTRSNIVKPRPRTFSNRIFSCGASTINNTNDTSQAAARELTNNDHTTISNNTQNLSTTETAANPLVLEENNIFSSWWWEDLLMEAKSEESNNNNNNNEWSGTAATSGGTPGWSPTTFRNHHHQHDDCDGSIMGDYSEGNIAPKETGSEEAGPNSAWEHWADFSFDVDIWNLLSPEVESAVRYPI